jgi:hypothetical protein
VAAERGVLRGVVVEPPEQAGGACAETCLRRALAAKERSEEEHKQELATKEEGFKQALAAKEEVLAAKRRREEELKQALAAREEEFNQALAAKERELKQSLTEKQGLSTQLSQATQHALHEKQELRQQVHNDDTVVRV